MFLLTFIFWSNQSPPWLWPMIGAAAGVYLFCHGFQLLRRKRLIMDTPSSKIRSAAMGLVEVSGLATGPYTLTSPITGVPCYYYRTMLWQWKQQGKSSSWVKEADESLHLPFYLDDGTARVLVNPQGAEMDIHRDLQEEFSHSLFSRDLEIPGNVTKFCVAHGVNSDKKIKIEEYCIKPKNALFILGTLATNPGIEVSAVPVRTLHTAKPGLSFNIGSSVSFSQTVTLYKGNAHSPEFAQSSPTAALGPDQQAKIADALTKAGITNPAAWAAAGINQAQTTAVAVSSTGSAAGAAPAPEFDLHPPTVLMKGEHNPAFFISWRSQREVVKSLGWQCTLMIWCGPVLTLVCVYFLAATYGWL
jgi:hypothetical protein